MAFETILVAKADGVATITLNRPQVLNALSALSFREISLALEDMQADTEIRSIVLTGAGNAFSAGGDIKEMSSNPANESMPFRDFMLTVRKTILDLHHLEKPVIAAVNGLAYGAGFSLALACDVILASEQASFCQVFVRIGLVPDGGSTFFLPRIIGTARAFPLVLSGEPISAHEAQSLGLISKVVPVERLGEETMAVARKLAQGPTRAMGLTKKLIYGGLEKSLAEQLDEEASYQALCRMTQDHKEGLQAFQEKRIPRFTGK